MKFDFPDPFAPIKTLIGRKGSFSISAMLLNPLTVMYSSAVDAIFADDCETWINDGPFGRYDLRRIMPIRTTMIQPSAVRAEFSNKACRQQLATE